MKITKILVPVDFSEHADRAFSFAAELAKTTGASLHVVHVSPPVPYLGPPFAPGPAFASELHAITRKAFDDYVAGLKKRGIEVGTTFAEGVAYLEINRAAADAGADLIVMGTHGRTGVEHALLGSVAERVVRTARVPVVVVPAVGARASK